MARRAPEGSRSDFEADPGQAKEQEAIASVLRSATSAAAAGLSLASSMVLEVGSLTISTAPTDDATRLAFASARNAKKWKVECFCSIATAASDATERTMIASGTMRHAMRRAPAKAKPSQARSRYGPRAAANAPPKMPSNTRIVPMEVRSTTPVTFSSADVVDAWMHGSIDVRVWCDGTRRAA